MSELIPLTGEPLAIDLTNTRPNTPDGPVDLLATPDALRSWLDRQRGRLPTLSADDSAALGQTDLDAVHTVREHSAIAINYARRGDRPPASALDGLNRALCAAPATRQLIWDGTSVAEATHRAGTTGDRLAAQLADAAADLLNDPAVTKVRQCEAHNCVLLFLPAHPRRRWCSPTVCGNRTRVARYYLRHKST